MSLSILSRNLFYTNIFYENFFYYFSIHIKANSNISDAAHLEKTSHALIIVQNIFESSNLLQHPYIDKTKSLLRQDRIAMFGSPPRLSLIPLF